MGRSEDCVNIQLYRSTSLLCKIYSKNNRVHVWYLKKKKSKPWEQGKLILSLKWFLDIELAEHLSLNILADASGTRQPEIIMWSPMSKMKKQTIKKLAGIEDFPRKWAFKLGKLEYRDDNRVNPPCRYLKNVLVTVKTQGKWGVRKMQCPILKEFLIYELKIHFRR